MSDSSQPWHQVEPPVGSKACAATIDERAARRAKFLVALFLLLLTAVAAMVATSAQGQEGEAKQTYDSVAINPVVAQDKNTRMLESAARSFASGGELDRKLVPYYFTKFIPGILTNPEYLPQVSSVMDDFHEVLDTAERNRSRLASVNSAALSTMSGLAKGNYPPVARINALVVLARLHARPAPDSRTPAEPLPAALPVMWDVYNNDSTPDAVRAAALSGIAKHVQFSFPRLPDALKSDLDRAMNELLDAKPPANRSDKAHAYLQRFAVDILDVLRANEDSSLGEKLIAISTERSRPDLIALHSAARLGDMGATLKGKIANPDQVLDRWSRRVLSVMEQELARLKSMERDQTAASPPDPEGFLPENLQARTKPQPSKGAAAGFEGIQMGSPGGRRSSPPPPKPKAKSGGMAEALQSGLMAPDAAAPRSGSEDASAQPPQVLASRGRLNHALQQLFVGVTGSTRSDEARRRGGLSASVADEAQTLINDWVDQMRPILNEINDLSIATVDQYKAILERETETLRDLLGAEPAEPAAG